MPSCFSEVWLTLQSRPVGMLILPKEQRPLAVPPGICRWMHFSGWLPDPEVAQVSRDLAPAHNKDQPTSGEEFFLAKALLVAAGTRQAILSTEASSEGGNNVAESLELLEFAASAHPQQCIEPELGGVVAKVVPSAAFCSIQQVSINNPGSETLASTVSKIVGALGDSGCDARETLRGVYLPPLCCGC
ncbi:hypothetical protein NDU88_006330 [Pleurodeles waltl]|uniref:Uncharacterized protein n=1 Tax=Pleurodeles waltl TaxID=8319 RepID=A0AAV7RM73_PLEWA|nr:hypothetical protein NDU88_006330 [Pleurodeles waltl]